MKDLGILKYFLGIEIAHGPDGLFLCQRKYALHIIDDAGLLGARPASFPMDTRHKLALSKSSILDDPKKYLSLCASLP